MFLLKAAQRLTLCPFRGTGGWDETTPFCRNQPKPRKLPKNAHAVPSGSSPTTMAPVLFAGDRVHAVLGAFSFYPPHGRIVKRFTIPSNPDGIVEVPFACLPSKVQLVILLK